jgi:uncharacterized protein (DUF1499 family)
MKRKLLLALALVVGLFVTATLVTASMWPVLNVVQTGSTPEYPDLLPQYFSADPKRVYDETERAVIQLDKWKIAQSRPESGQIEATRETSLWGFIDDVTIEIHPQTEFVTRVDVRSASRVGKGDFGQNARNVRELQAEIDRRLGAVRFDPYATADAD